MTVRGGEGGAGWLAPRRNASYDPLSDFIRVRAVAASSRAELTLEGGREGGRGRREEGREGGKGGREGGREG